jgi:hypothetical protein
MRLLVSRAEQDYWLVQPQPPFPERVANRLKGLCSYSVGYGGWLASHAHM